MFPLCDFQVQHSHFHVQVFIRILLSFNLIVLCWYTMTPSQGKAPRPPAQGSASLAQPQSPSSPAPNLSSTVRMLHIDKCTNAGSAPPMVVMSRDPPSLSRKIVFCDHSTRRGWSLAGHPASQSP